MLNWITWNRTVLTFKLRTNAKLNSLIWNCLYALKWIRHQITYNCWYAIKQNKTKPNQLQSKTDGIFGIDLVKRIFWAHRYTSKKLEKKDQIEFLLYLVSKVIFIKHL